MDVQSWHIICTPFPCMPTENERKYIAKYVEDLHSLIAHGLQPVSHQVREHRQHDHAAAVQFVDDLQRTLQEHERRLSMRLADVGTSPTTGIQDAAASIAGFVAGIYNQV